MKEEKKEITSGKKRNAKFSHHSTCIERKKSVRKEEKRRQGERGFGITEVKERTRYMKPQE